MPRKQYKNPPITSATIEIILERNPKAVLDVQKLSKKLEKKYSSVKTLFVATADIDTSVSTVNTRRENIGLLVEGKNEKIQMRADRFIYTFTGKYKNWESFIKRAQSPWIQYKNAVTPKKITRIGVRFVNKLTIKKNKLNLEEYFRATPKMPDGFDKPIGGFHLDLFIPNIEKGVNAILKHSISPQQEDKNRTTVFLDIDVYSLNSMKPDDKILWKQYRKLRDHKDELFEISITDKTRRMFGHA